MTTLSLPKVHWAIWTVPAAVVAISAAVHGVMMLVPAPADLDYALTRPSDAGTFVATVEPGTVAIGETETWTIAIETADGSPVALDAITIDGGMPLHGHGLPTQPEVTRDLGDGRYEVEGMLFSMGGWWVVNVHVDTASGADTATFNFSL